jgi:hypothetical protein
MTLLILPETAAGEAQDIGDIIPNARGAMRVNFGDPVTRGTSRDAEVRSALRAAGWTVVDCAGVGSGFPDLLIAKHGVVRMVEIKDGATTTIDAGPPFVLNATVSKAQNTPQGKVVRITLQVLGKMGEVYAPNTLRKGQTVAPAPQFEVLDEKGTSLAKGNFEYG